MNVPWCDRCGCNSERTCVCARECVKHPIMITVPSRMRGFLTGSGIWDEPKERHGYGDAGDRLVEALRPARSRDKILLDAGMRGVLIELAETMFNVTADDARWDSDAKNDRQAARVTLRKLGVEP
jgi:hypothetical protein